MQTKYLSKAVFLAVIGTFCLTGCHTTKPSTVGASDMSAEANTQTAGLNEKDGFYGANQTPAERLKAPQNQTYHFDFDKYEVQQEDVGPINAQANYLASHAKAKVRIEGNADERGSREYNVTLGWKRAKSVATMLKQQGVATSQIAVVSFGKEKPVAFGHDEASYRLNRRVDLIYEAK